MQIALSYFYQIRFFYSYMIPVSTALWDPKWYHMNNSSMYKYVDKNGVINGIRYELFNPHNEDQAINENHKYCTLCSNKDKELNKINHNCDFLLDYYKKLCTLDYNKVMSDLNAISTNVQNQLKFTHDPLVVLIVHESPDNPCSERWILMKYFQEHNYPLYELQYPVQTHYQVRKVLNEGI